MSDEFGESQSPAGWYGNPQQPTVERWWDGRNWTEHYRAKAVEPHVHPTQATASLSSLACPNCGWQDVKTLKIIHAHGTSTGRGVSTGWVQGGGGQSGHLAQFNTSIKTVTEAARAAAPPRKRSNGVVLVVIGAVVAIAAGWLGPTLTAGVPGTLGSGVVIVVTIGVLVVIGGLIVAIFDAGYNRNVFPESMARWDRSWQCQRCGAVFVI